MTTDLRDALFEVRAAQGKARAQYQDMPEPNAEDVKHRALERLNQRRATWRPRRHGGIHSWGLGYDERQEAERIALTAEMLQRFEPGNAENPVFAERLARHAASLSAMRSPDVRPDPLAQAILATTVEPYPTARTQQVRAAGVVLLSSGLLHMLQVIADSVIAAWVRAPTARGSLGSWGTDFEAVRAKLAVDRSPVERLAEAFEGLLFHGELFSEAVVPEEEWNPGQRLIVTAAERFIVAHEYGHVALHSSTPPSGPAGELEADAWGLLSAIGSLGSYDLFAPNMSMQGVFTALSAISLIGRALSLVTSRPSVALNGSATHPPMAVRMEALNSPYQALVAGESPLASDLTPARFALRTLELIWDEVEPKFAGRSREELHSVWTDAVLDIFLLQPTPTRRP